jgi:hypothetical protein
MLSAKLSHEISQAIFCIAGFAKASLYQRFGSRPSLQLARLSLRLLSGEKALARDWREQ